MADSPVKLKILVIENQPEVAKTIEILLHRVGFETTIANSGAEGMDLARKEKFDLIATDVDLPDVNGFEICAQLKKDFRFLRTPVVLISGRSPEKNRQRALESGAADFISKPFDSFLFVSRILTHVKPARD